jgi:hypothetical protein
MNQDRCTLGQIITRMVDAFCEQEILPLRTVYTLNPNVFCTILLALLSPYPGEPAGAATSVAEAMGDASNEGKITNVNSGGVAESAEPWAAI